ncbi:MULTISPECIES: DinB family protein [Emticicia]|nr:MULTISPECIES: DinB family protein [Emticicia]
MLELLEINFADINKVIKKEEMGQLIAYHNTKGDSFTNTISEIFSHLLLHSAYHRGQVVILLKGNIEQLPMTDYILFKR